MAWTKVDHTLLGNPKTMKAINELGMSLYEFIGHLIAFWLWALEFSDEGGNLKEIVTAEMITKASGCSDSSWVKTLLDAGGKGNGFLVFRDGHYIIHDWQEYGGKYIKEKRLQRESQLRFRAKPKLVKEAITKEPQLDPSASQIIAFDAEHFADFRKAYEQKAGRLINNQDIGLRLNDIAKTYKLEDFAEACAIARKNQKVGLQYIESILRDWDNNGKPERREVGKYQRPAKAAGRQLPTNYTPPP